MESTTANQQTIESDSNRGQAGASSSSWTEPTEQSRMGSVGMLKRTLIVFVGLAVAAVGSRISLTGEKSILPNYLRNAPFNNKSRRRLQKIQARIVGGTDSTPGEFPFVVGLYRTTDIYEDKAPACGGSLITPSVVLTAAHCMGDFKRIEINRYRQSDDRDVDRYFDFELRINPDYNPKIVNNDVGLVKLPTPQLVAPPIGLATDETEVPSSLTVMGWGQLSLDGNQPDILQHVSIHPVSQNTCREAYTGFSITDQMFCASAPGKDACLGDSGGPVVIPEKNIQLGVVSWGIGCADGTHPGVYAKVSAMRDWIEKTVCTDLSPGDCVHGKLPNYANADPTPQPSCSPPPTPSPTPQTESPSLHTESPTIQTESPTIQTESPTQRTARPTFQTERPTAPSNGVTNNFETSNVKANSRSNTAPPTLIESTPPPSAPPSMVPTLKPSAGTSTPSQLPTSSPTAVPTSKPTSSPTRMPTTTPTINPTNKPSREQKVLTLTNPKCHDRQGLFLQLHGSAGSSKRTTKAGCSWVAQDKTTRCPLLGEKFCPETCQVARCRGKAPLQ